LPTNPGSPIGPAGAFRATLHSRPDSVWVHAAGELDIATVPVLEQLLRDAQGAARLVVLDLEELTFIAGCGVRVVADAAVRARAAGHRLMVLRPPVHLRDVFDLAGLAPEIESARRAARA
jgi:anti-anti-sigma factor